MREPLRRLVEHIRTNPVWLLFPAAAVFLVILHINTGQWFWGDEWELISTRSRPPLSDPAAIARTYLRPHNEHWSTIPIIIYRAVFGVVGLRAYWPYAVVLVAVHLIACWLVMRRLRLDGVDNAVVFMSVTVLLVYGAGAQNLLWAFQIGWIGSLIFGLWHLELAAPPRPGPTHDPDVSPTPELAQESNRRRRTRIGWLAGIASLACSGVGMGMIAAVGAAVAIRRGWRAAVQAVGVPVAVYVLWFATYGRTGVGDTEVDRNRVWRQLVPYVWRSLTSTVEHTLGLSGVGPVVVVVIAAAAAQRWPRASAHAEAFGLAIAAGVLMAVVAFGRAILDDPDASRYAYSNYVMLAPLAAVLLTELLRGQRSMKVLFGVVAVGALLSSVSQLLDAADTEGKLERVVADDLRAAFEIAPSPFAAGGAIPQEDTIDLTVADVRRLLAQRKTPNGRPSLDARVRVLARTSTDISGFPRVALSADAISLAAIGRVKAEPAESGCVSFVPFAEHPQISFLPHRVASIKVVPQVGGVLRVFVRSKGRTSDPVTYVVGGNNTVFLNFVDPRNEYVIELPGWTKACGFGQEIPKES